MTDLRTSMPYQAQHQSARQPAPHVIIDSSSCQRPSCPWRGQHPAGQRAAASRRIVLLAAVLLPAFAARIAAQPAPSAVQTIPFEYIDHIFIDVTLNEAQRATLLYDPVQNILLDRSYAARRGIPTYGGEEVGYGGPVRVGGAGAEEHVVRFARDVQMAVGGQSFVYPVVPVIPLDSVMATALGRHVDGLFGTTVLDAYVLEFDFDRERFVLHDPARFTAPQGYAELPITRMGRAGKPTVPGTLDLGDGRTLDGHFLLDFGMGGTLRLTTRFVDEHRLAEHLAPAVASGAERGLGGTLQSLVTRLPALTLAGLRIEDLVTSLAREATGADAAPEWDGLIGLGLLDRFHFFLDLQGDRLWLRPGPRFDEPFVYVPLGLHFAVPDPAFGGLRILEVAPASPAQRAGLHAGDTIIAVDGVAVHDWNSRHWETAVRRRVGGTLTLAVRRDAATVEMTLPLDNPLATTD